MASHVADEGTVGDDEAACAHGDRERQIERVVGRVIGLETDLQATSCSAIGPVGAGGTSARNSASPSRASSAVKIRRLTCSHSTLVASASQKSGISNGSEPAASVCARWLSGSSSTHFSATLASTTRDRVRAPLRMADAGPRPAAPRC